MKNNMIGPQSVCTLQTLTTSVDSLGSIVETYTNVKSISGVLTKPSKGTQVEKLLNGKMSVIADYVFFMDYDSSIIFSEKDRLVCGNRTFDILWSYNPGNMSHHLELYIREIK